MQQADGFTILRPATTSSRLSRSVAREALARVGRRHVPGCTDFSSRAGCGLLWSGPFFLRIEFTPRQRERDQRSVASSTFRIEERWVTRRQAGCAACSNRTRMQSRRTQVWPDGAAPSAAVPARRPCASGSGWTSASSASPSAPSSARPSAAWPERSGAGGQSTGAPTGAASRRGGGSKQAQYSPPSRQPQVLGSPGGPRRPRLPWELPRSRWRTPAGNEKGHPSESGPSTGQNLALIEPLRCPVGQAMPSDRLTITHIGWLFKRSGLPDPRASETETVKARRK